MEALTDTLDESLLNKVIASLNLDLVRQLLIDVVLILGSHKVGHFTSIENVVDVLKERLLEDVRVGHRERDVLAHNTGGEHELLDELMEVFCLVVLLDFNLAELELVHERREADE